MPSVDAIVRRRSAVTSGLLLLVILCWAWIIAMALDMYGRMSGPASWMMTTSWDAAHVSLLFAMWTVMMAGMMLPSAAPAITQYANVLRDHGTERPSLHAAVFAAGYVFVWTLFSAVATIVQRAITEARLLNPMMEPAMPVFAGGLLLISGTVQLLPFKRHSLSSCRSYGAFGVIRNPGLFDAFRAGTRYGFSCLACCWSLMLLLFAGGVMNLEVIGALTLVVLFERTAAFGLRSTPVTGVALIGLGLWTIAR